MGAAHDRDGEEVSNVGPEALAGVHLAVLDGMHRDPEPQEPLEIRERLGRLLSRPAVPSFKDQGATFGDLPSFDQGDECPERTTSDVLT